MSTSIWETYGGVRYSKDEGHHDVEQSATGPITETTKSTGVTRSSQCVSLSPSSQVESAWKNPTLKVVCSTTNWEKKLMELRKSRRGR